ncbi:MAG: hypothetical protein WBW32_06760 [Luteibacter sp.]
MATDTLSLFRHYAGILRDPGIDFAAHVPLPSELHMAGDARHDVFYAPFDHLNAAARIVLVGLSPGRAQALVALETARRVLLTGTDDATAAAAAKHAASWSGPIRHNLVRMLDFLGVASRLELTSTAELWTTRTDLVHFSAALRYPVFVGGKNFNGTGVDRNAFLLEQVDAWFAAECAQLNERAVYVALGAAAQVACDRVVARGLLRPGQIIAGLPHPSGANAERVAYFLGQKARETLSAQTRPGPLDLARESALRTLATWTP